MQPVAGAHVVNLLGSHGTKAAAMALLGAASATVVDVSPANARYGGELAAALGVDVKYVVCDVLQVGVCVSVYERRQRSALHPCVDTFLRPCCVE